MARWLYNLCFPFVFLLMLPGYLRRMMRRGNYRQHFGQRFGVYSPAVRQRLLARSGALWLQAVSVGEMLVALKLVAAVRAQQSARPIVLSTTTTTGFQLARQNAMPDVEVIYTPIDLRRAVRRAFDTIRPAHVVIVDGGLWPNLLWEARRRGIPTSLVNARLSPRSERRFHRFGALSGFMFRLLHWVCVAEPGDVARWHRLGVPTDKIRLSGSIKYDDSPAGANESKSPVLALSHSRVADRLWSLLAPLGIDRKTPILLAGSTHPGEEKLIASVFLELRQQHGDLFLLVAPRHVERTPDVRAELASLGLRIALRTSLGLPRSGSLSAADATEAKRPDVMLLDTTGELRDWYAVATLVIIGKSLAAIGGQNPAEAVAAGKAVIFGPHMENFQELTDQLLNARAAVQVAGASALTGECLRLLGDAGERSRLAAAAAAVIAIHRGAAQRTANLLLTQV